MMGTWLLVTYLMSAPCQANGPLAWWLNDAPDTRFCRYQKIVGMDSARFRTFEACEADASRRWVESGYRTASRCTRTR